VSPPPRHDHLLLDIVVAVVAQYCDYNTVCILYVVINAHLIVMCICVCVCVLLCAHANYFRTTTLCPQFTIYCCRNSTTRAPNAVHRTTASETTDAFNNRTTRDGRVRERL
jgi:hypothetical protein